MRRQRRKHDQDLRKLDRDRLEMLDEEGTGAERFTEDLGKVTGHTFDFRRWREDLAERSFRRARMRARDMRRGLLRDHPGAHEADWDEGGSLARAAPAPASFRGGELRAGVELVRLAPAARWSSRLEAAGDQRRGELDRAADQVARALVQELGLLHVAHVVLHVLGAPAARMGDVREGREVAADLGEEGQHLAPATAWTPSWPPVMMKLATLFFRSCTLAIVSWFCTQFMRSTIL